MYQIKCNCGLEIQVIGKGENGFARVIRQGSQRVEFAGAWPAVEQWLADRGVEQFADNGNYSHRPMGEY
jgi:hypothetical protein